MTQAIGKVSAVDAERMLAALNGAQRAAVTSDAQPLCILAGAGSGKTRVLTRRIGFRAATGALDPRRTLALTFTRKAANELNSRLRQLGLRDRVAAGTFHSVAFAQLRSRWDELGVRAPRLLDRKVGFILPLIPRSATSGRGDRSTNARVVVGEIEWAKARTVSPDDYADAAAAARRRTLVDPALIVGVYASYEKEKRAKRLVDFDDLLSLCRLEIERNDSFRDAQRWRFRHFYVDEFQDVNPLQHALLAAWLGDRSDLCVVGDPNQAIYGWNGADASYLRDFGEHFPGGEILRLTENYRSSPQILSVANTLLDQNERRVSALAANRPDAEVPCIRAAPDDTAEAVLIARAVRDHRSPGAPWSAQAILVRTNAQAAPIESALRAARIPFRVRGGGGLLDQPEIRSLLHDLRSMHAPFHTALADLDATFVDRYSAPAGDGSDPPTDATTATTDAAANVSALLRLGHDYAALDPAPSVPGFLTWLADTVGADQPDDTGDAVEIATFHASKGLEWPIVHIAGAEHGFVPMNHATTAAALAEEQRLFYVAVTRAERELCITWVESRIFGDRSVARRPSPYLAGVEAVCAAMRAGVDPARAIAREAGVGDSHRSPGESTPGGRAAIPPTHDHRDRPILPGGVAVIDQLTATDRAVFDSLRNWRSGAARAASVPPSVIFSDATLAAIAASRPADEASLLEVPGIGPVKALRFGATLLRILDEHG